jgi:hypothetical protein
MLEMQETTRKESCDSKDSPIGTTINIFSLQTDPCCEQNPPQDTYIGVKLPTFPAFVHTQCIFLLYWFECFRITSEELQDPDGRRLPIAISSSPKESCSVKETTPKPVMQRSVRPSIGTHEERN